MGMKSRRGWVTVFFFHLLSEYLGEKVRLKLTLPFDYLDILRKKRDTCRRNLYCQGHNDSSQHLYNAHNLLDIIDLRTTFFCPKCDVALAMTQPIWDTHERPCGWILPSKV